MVRAWVVSDLHLEGAAYNHELPDADVAILAGDIAVAWSLHRNAPAANFFDRVSKKYEKVLYIMGNHEHYGGDISTSLPTLKRVLREDFGLKNIYFLHDRPVIHNGVLFLGSTLWTDFRNGDDFSMQFAGRCMNDYRIITKNGGKNILTPEDTLRMHRQEKDYLASVLDIVEPDLPAVVVTHMGPSLKAVYEPKYGGDALNAAFCSDLDEFFTCRNGFERVKYWIQGHTHEAVRYTLGTTDVPVICNPRGYRGEPQDMPFDPNLVIEIVG